MDSYRIPENNYDTSFYYALNYRGDVIGLYSSTGTLIAKYTYDVWGNVLSVTNATGAEITSSTHIALLQPFRYRSYYFDQESNFYYLQTRYYDPATHRFINADGLVSTGTGILGYNMFAYCENNPVNHDDPTGEKIYFSNFIGPLQPDDVKINSAFGTFLAERKNFEPRTDKRKNYDKRQKSGDRERNVGHPNGEEHSRVHKGTGLKKIGFAFVGLSVLSLTAFLGVNDLTGIGVLDDSAIPFLLPIVWDSFSKAFT